MFSLVLYSNSGIAVRPYSSVRGMDGQHSVDDFRGRHNDDAESTAPDLREASGLRCDRYLKFSVSIVPWMTCVKR